MKNKILVVALFSLAFLNNCSKPENTMVTEKINISTVKVNRVEDQVDRSRMEGYMAVLTGKKPVINDILIRERGSVEGRNLTRTFLINTLEALGYKVEQNNYRKNGTNIVARLMSESPSDEYILIGAHLDSVNNAGADDDGSGSTAVLEAATVLPKLNDRKVNIIFSWFDEEELGMIGSKSLASEYKKQGLKITSAHTIDMMGWDKDGDNAVELARPDGILWDYYNMVNEKHNLKIPLERTSTGSSDHVPFHQNGFPSLNLSEEWVNNDTTPYYHQKKDIYETINFDYLASGTKLLVAVVGDLSMKVPPPANIKLVPHENFPGREREFHKF